MIELLRHLHQYPALSAAAWYNAILLVLSVAGMVVDKRQILGVSPWLKPVKFETSILILLITVSWMLVNLPASGQVKRMISGTVAVAMIIEITAIVVQSARGVPSHFNSRAPFDAAVFALMGIVIVANTLAVLWMTVLYFRPVPALEPALLWGVRLGLVLFLLASLEGFVMMGKRAHTVGAADGGSGLTFVNWSTRSGDLRVSHFLGMHGIQILPLLGWLLSRQERGAGTAAVVAVFGVMLLLFGGALLQALAGKPLLRLESGR